MSVERSAQFLDLIRRAERGRLKIYLGYGPGVGKTYQMLQEAHRLKADGIHVVIGFVETHSRPETAALLGGLECLPRRRTEYRGISVEEFDLEGCLARRPQVAIVDELAHTNVPGSKNTKRYEDIQELLAAGIHVISALNVQHLESLYNTVESLVGVKVRERVPDAILADADQVVNVDVVPEDLQKRLREGKIYPPARVADSLENFFRVEKLENLRELAFRELAGQIDTRRRERPASADTASQGAIGNSDQIMVCLSSKGPSSARLLRFGSRLAGRLNRNWYAVYVQTAREDPLRIDARTQRLLADTLTLANGLGATVFTFKGDDVASTLIRFAREYHVGQLVIGKPRPIPFVRRLLGDRSVAERLLFQADGLNVIVVDGEATQAEAKAGPPSNAEEKAADPRSPLTALADPRRIRILPSAPSSVVPSREVVLRDLLAALSTVNPALNPENIFARLSDRESQGSTFLNEGIALPHARIPELQSPEIALALTPAGVADVPSSKQIEVVMLLLSSAGRNEHHLQLLSSAARLFQSRELRKALIVCETPEAAAAILKSRV